MLFAASGNKAEKATNGSCPFDAAERAGDFLLHFHHAQISFGLILIEWNFEIMRERQDCPSMRAQPLKEIVAFCFSFFVRGDADRPSAVDGS